METTPNDLRQQQFEIKFRGYNPDDVEVFRDLAADALEEARAEGLKLTEENRHLTERLEHLVSIEETLKAAVLEAQKNAESTTDNAKKEAETTVANAKKEAELIIREAHQRRDEIIADMHRQMSKLVGDINKIRFIRSNYLSKLKVLINSQLEMIENEIREDEKEKPTSAEVPQEMPITAQQPPPVETPPEDEAEEQEEKSREDDEWKDLREELTEE
jgi:cell division initiation protein